MTGLILWEIAALMGWISSLFFPPPSQILSTLGRMAIMGKLWPTLTITLYRLMVGVAIGAGAGLLLGWLMGSSHSVRIALDPIVAGLHPLPKLAMFPIFLVLFGMGEASKVALVAMSVFFPMVINTLAGVRLGVGRGLVGVVVGELIASQAGIGNMMSRTGATFQTDKVFVGVVILALCGWSLTALLEALERRFDSWRPQR